MNSQRILSVSLATLLVMTLDPGRIAGAQALPDGADGPAVTTAPRGAVGAAFTYQGRIQDGGAPVTGQCDLQLSLWDALTDGIQIGPADTQAGVEVSQGLFTATLSFGVDAFDGNARWLSIATRCPAGSGSYVTLSPRQPLSPVPYAVYSLGAGTAASLHGVLPVENGGTGSTTKSFVDLDTAQTVAGVKTFADAPGFSASGAPFGVSSTALVDNLNADLLDGIHAGSLQRRAQNVVVVATSGGDYASIQAAVDDIGDASESHPYLVWVAPGVYAETVVMKPYVHVQGAGQGATLVTSSAGNPVWPATTGTVTLAASTSLRDLTVECTGSSPLNVAILAPNGATGTRVANVTAHARGAATGDNVAVFQSGPGSSVTLDSLTALAENGSLRNYALSCTEDGSTTLHGGTYTARGSGEATGVRHFGTSGRLDAFGITALAMDATIMNTALAGYGTAVTLHGGSFSARGGEFALAVNSDHDTGSLHATGIVALAEGASMTSIGLKNGNHSTATLLGGSFTARDGGSFTLGVSCFQWANLHAEGITATAEGGANASGLMITQAATVTVSGGSFVARNGQVTMGITSTGMSSLEAHGVKAQGRDGQANYGLQITGPDTTTKLRGGDFSGHGGEYACGVFVEGTSERLDASGVTLLAEGGTTSSTGLACGVGVNTTITQSLLSGSTNSVSMVAGSTVTLSNSRLEGATSGPVSCTAVSRDTTFNATGCP